MIALILTLMNITNASQESNLLHVGLIILKMLIDVVLYKISIIKVKN